MRHHIFEEANTYDIAVLVKGSAFNKQELINNYITPLNKAGVPSNKIIAFTLDYNSSNKAPAAFIKEYLDKLLTALDSLQVKHLYVADSAYFKALAGQVKAEPHFGYFMPCKVKGFEHMSVVLGLNHQVLIYNPVLQDRLDMSLKTLVDGVQGTYQALGTGIIHSAGYPEGTTEIAQALQKLHGYPALSCDIETFSLRFNEAGIGTIAFAWDQHNGIAFACDYHNSYQGLSHQDPSWPGSNIPNPAVRALLKTFFETYKGNLTFHHAGFDLKPLIYNLWMSDLLDTKGLLTGLDVMTRSIDCTKIISYLALNSTAGNVLGLKTLAHEFAGNWAVDEIKDIRRIPLKQLLQYNLVDCLSTNYVKAKNYPVMVQDKQEDLYKGLMLPSLKMITQTELTGMPLNAKKVQEVKGKLSAIRDKALATIHGNPVIALLNLVVQTKAMKDANAKLKVKQHPLSKFSDVVFNPNSGPQLQELLYVQMGLPVLDLTETKQPATGAETIKKLINHTTVQGYKDVLAALIEFGGVSTVLETFIPAFERAIIKGTGDIVWLHGNFNLGGTVSGRLSSSDPNLQNIPAGSEYGDLIKECFEAPVGWLMCGADYNSLEDMISALTTKDPNKLAVYTQGFDGHCLRAAFYYDDVLTMIDKADPKSVNSIKKSHPDLRQDSKTPTFLLTYGGTHHGMVQQLGWTKEKAIRIEARYHELYKHSDEYVKQRLQQASKDGYVEVAFGLRVRTPLLAQCLLGWSKVPFEAQAEGRTAGNAMGQSYGLLNNRAGVAFMNKVWASKYRYDIKPIGLIHDALYYLIRDDAEVMEWANRELIQAMQWQELPEIQHPTVKLGAALDIFWPNWANATTVPNGADRQTIIEICKGAKEEFFKPK